MNTRKDEKAFPTVVPDDFSQINFGMTLRDYFASAALQCIASRFAEPADIAGQAIPVAEDAYKIADAMLAEREKGCAP